MPKSLNAQVKNDFVKQVWPAAQAVGKKIGVPPLFILSQIVLETRYGLSLLWSKYNNPGGIKATGSQAYVILPTKEDLNPGVNDGKTKVVYQRFAKFATPQAGIEAHSKILTNRYFAKYANKTKDPIKYAELLQSGAPKYATDDFYVKKIANTLKDINSLQLI